MTNRALRYEIGPIRPPNEAYSLLVRFTRNCSWNQCAFCHIYKERKFEKRSFDEIKRDIDTIKEIADDIKQISWEKGYGGTITETLVEEIFSSNIHNECYKSIAVWLYFGGKHVFIQDANSLAMNPQVFIDSLKYLKETFPTIDRVTSYARSRTIAKRVTLEDLNNMKDAGLTRLHIGLESGNNFLLKFMNKGVTKAEHIECGRKVKQSGIELSEYVVLGMGGRQWWREHALETADALNKIDSDFIRFRTLKVLKTMPLYEKLQNKDFFLPTEEDILLNLLEEVDGKLPEDKEKMLSVIDDYFSLTPEQKVTYRFGRRSGIYRSINDLNDELTYFRIRKAINEMEDKEPGSVEKTISLLLENYI